MSGSARWRREAALASTRVTTAAFAEIFKAAEYDFYKIDGALFAPAEVWVSNLDSGAPSTPARCDMDLLRVTVAEGGLK
jgi:methenyltetrahydromethanopterin cyclohydrolase